MFRTTLPLDKVRFCCCVIYLFSQVNLFDCEGTTSVTDSIQSTLTSSAMIVSSTSVATTICSTPCSNNTTTSSSAWYESENVIIPVAFAGALLILIISMLTVCLIKRRKEKRRKNKRSNYWGNDDTGCKNLGISFLDSEYSRSEVKEDMYGVNSKMDTPLSMKPDISPPANATSGSECATPNIERVVVNGDTDVVSNKNKTKEKESMEPGTSQPANVSSDSGHATLDFDKDMYAVPVVNEEKTTESPKQEDTTHSMEPGTSQPANVSSDFGHATPDFDKDMYAMPVVNEEKTTKSPEQEDIPSPPANATSDSECTTPDIERVVVNGDTYSVVNNEKKTSKKPKQKVEEVQVDAKTTKSPEEEDTPQSMEPDTSPPANATSGSECTMPDIERIVVNGDTYAVVNNEKKASKKLKQKVEDVQVDAKTTKSPKEEGTPQSSMEHGTVPPANATSGSEYTTPDIERVVVNGDTYAVVNNEKKTSKKTNQKKTPQSTRAAANISPDPGYATADCGTDTYSVVNEEKTIKPLKQEDRSQSMEPGTSQRANVSSDYGYSDFDEDMYAMPVMNKEKTTKSPEKERNFAVPENVGLDESNRDVDGSSQLNEYASIVDVMPKELK